MCQVLSTALASWTQAWVLTIIIGDFPCGLPGVADPASALIKMHRQGNPVAPIHTIPRRAQGLAGLAPWAPHGQL